MYPFIHRFELLQLCTCFIIDQQDIPANIQGHDKAALISGNTMDKGPLPVVHIQISCSNQKT